MIKDQYGVQWEREVDPNMRIRAGTMDCTRLVPKKPWWSDKVVKEDPITGIRYKSVFKVPEGEKPIMGRNYVENIPVGVSDVLVENFLEIRDGINSNLKNLKSYWQKKVLPTLRKIGYKR